MEEQQTEQVIEQPEAALETPAQDETPAVAQVETPAEPQEDIETLKKRLADTQRWAHQQAQRAAALERSHDQARLQQIEAGLQPEVRTVVDQAIEARTIRDRIAEQEGQAKAALIQRSVLEAIPEVEGVLNNAEFGQQVTRAADALRAQGKDLGDPVYAIRAVNTAYREFTRNQARAAAEQAEQARKQSKLAAMAVPGAGAQGATPTPRNWKDDAAGVWNMSEAEFAKMQAKARGF